MMFRKGTHRSAFFTLMLVVVFSLVTVTALANDAKGATSQGDKLACQKNNPERLDCSSLEVTAVCEADTAIFTIRNTGEAGDGDMRSPTQYRLIVDGVVVETGPVLMGGATTMTIVYSGGGTVTLEADQQVGHPGNSLPQVTLNCAPAATVVPPTPVPTVQPTPVVTEEPTPIITEEPTPEATEEPTPVLTEEPTPEDPGPNAPSIVATSRCDLYEGMITFDLTNNGITWDDMISYYVVTPGGDWIDEGWLFLWPGESLSLAYSTEYGALTLHVGDGLIVRTESCGGPALDITPYCPVDAGFVFEIRNNGADMGAAEPYTVTDQNGYWVDSGEVYLLSNESTMLYYPADFDSLTLEISNLAYSYLECLPAYPTPVVTEEPTPVVTEEVTPLPTEEPTQEPTAEPTPLPTEEPTQEPTDEPTEEPTAEPTSVPTERAPLSCQKNNPDRLDCSSLEVTATCEGGTAVFTIRNGGEAGDGDMRFETEYRLLVGNTVIETGAVLLDGREAMQITYSGGQRVTLQADQQIGHPGKSQPRATIQCK
jgi:predicted RNA-binding protein with TRAM domain